MSRPDAPSPLPPPLLGRWRTDLAHPIKIRQPPSVVPRCMRCQILSQREKGDDSALDALVDQEMQRRVARWLTKKGL